MATLQQLIDALDDLRATVADEIRSRNRMLLWALAALGVALLINTVLTITALNLARDQAASRALATERSKCANLIQSNAESAAYHQIDQIIAVTLARAAERLTPEERATFTPPPEPTVAELETSRIAMAEGVRRLGAINDICYGHDGPDPNPLAR